MHADTFSFSFFIHFAVIPSAKGNPTAHSCNLFTLLRVASSFLQQPKSQHQPSSQLIRHWHHECAMFADAGAQQVRFLHNTWSVSEYKQILEPPSRRCFDRATPGGSQVSPGLPTAHSPARSEHFEASLSEDFCSLPAGACQALQGAWLRHHRGRSHLAVPVVAPLPSGLGRKQGWGNVSAAPFPATPAVAGPEGWQRAPPSLSDGDQVHAGAAQVMCALIQMAYNPLACTLLGGDSFSPVLSAGITAREPPPSSHLSQLSLPSCQPQWGAAASACGCEGGLVSPIFSAVAKQGWEDISVCFSLPASDWRVPDTWSVSHVCLFLWPKPLSVFHFLWFVWMWTVGN